MLNFVYYPVSFILWCWHGAFGFVLGDTSAAGWALSIVFLVFTLRALLLRPAMTQMRTMNKMQQVGPQMKAIQHRHSNDRRRQMAEVAKLQGEHGVSPLGGCLPMILQIPVFIGLNHVLRTFTQHPDQPNYFFPLADVHSYLAARLFDAHLGDAIFNTGVTGGSVTGHVMWTWGVAPVAIPLMIIAAIATHFTARLSSNRTMQVGAGVGQSQLMRHLAMWVLPFGVLLFGGALPVGLLIYWVSNNVWTLVQQHVVLKKLAAEDREKECQSQQLRSGLAPKPGQRPPQPNKAARSTAQTRLPSEATAQSTGKSTPQSCSPNQAAGVPHQNRNGSARQTRDRARNKSHRKRPKR